MASSIFDALPDGSPGWSTTVQTGSYDGLAFDFVSTQDEIASVVDRQQMPNRNGVFLEKRANEGRVFDVLGIFVEGDYPDVMNRLIDKINNATEPKTFVHPIFGSFKALVTRASISHSADDAIDSATIQLHVEEHTAQAQGPTAVKTSLAARASATRAAVDAALTTVTQFAAAVDAIGSASANVSAAQQSIVDQAVANATVATTLAADAADSFEADASEMSADEVQAQANAVLAQCNAVVVAISSFTIGTTPVPEQYDLSQAMVTLAATTSAMAIAAAAGLPSLTTYTVDADVPLLVWVFGKYGDSSRADEVLALNPWINDPLLLPAGAEVTAYAP